MKFQSRLELNKSPWDKDLSKWLRATFVWRGHSNLESFPENSIPTLKILKASSSSLCCRDDAFIAGDDSKLKSLAQTQFPWAAKSQCHRRGRWQDLKVCRKMSKSQLTECNDKKTSLLFLLDRVVGWKVVRLLITFSFTPPICQNQNCLGFWNLM